VGEKPFTEKVGGLAEFTPIVKAFAAPLFL